VSLTPNPDLRPVPIQVFNLQADNLFATQPGIVDQAQDQEVEPFFVSFRARRLLKKLTDLLFFEKYRQFFRGFDGIYGLCGVDLIAVLPLQEAEKSPQGGQFTVYAGRRYP